MPTSECRMNRLNRDIPAQIGVIPAQIGVIPAQIGVIPAQIGVIPAQIGVIPAQAVILPPWQYRSIPGCRTAAYAGTTATVTCEELD